MPPQQLSVHDEVDLPPGTVDLRRELVPAIREFLARGLSDSFQRACVRIGSFDAYSGGLKASLVGGLRIDVHAVLKLGSTELLQHVQMMNYVNGLRARTFPAVLHQQCLSDGRVFIITEQCRKHVTLLDKVYGESTTKAEFRNILDKVFDSLREMHRVTRGSAPSLAGLPTNPDPFSKRIRSKLSAILEADSELKVMMDRPGIVLGAHCPPLAELLARTDTLCRWAARAIQPRLVHGDPHLGNIMARRNGPAGYRVRLIDPNPEIGFSQPLYDVGKLFHWAEPVGWAKTCPRLCRAGWSVNRGTRQWSLSACLSGASAASERRRQWVESAVGEFSRALSAGYGSEFPRMVGVAVASAHLGLAALLADRKQKQARRFVLAHALKHLQLVEQ